MGIDEVGPELFAASLMQLGMIPSSITAAELASLLADPTRSIHLREALATTSASDELEAVRRADAAQLRRARTVANGLAGFGAIYLMHGLLMPDTPGFAELRSRIDELGLRDLLMALGPSMRSTAGFVSTVVSCLSPWMSNLYDTLLDGVEKGPGLLHGPDDQHTAAKFIDEWMGTIAKLRSERGDSDSSM